MSDHTGEKQHGPIDHARETMGIYRLGFERESFLGFALPFLIVGLIGGLGAAIIYFFL